MIILFRGSDPLDEAIEGITWSPYSHAAFYNPATKNSIEAIALGVVEAIPYDQHHHGVPVDFFEVIGATPEQEAAAEQFCRDQLGKGYDWIGDMHFITHRPENPAGQQRWFCSELVFAAYASTGILLLRGVPVWKVSPGLLSVSPMLAKK